MDTHFVNCFVCDVTCVAKDQHFGSDLARILTMSLSSVLSKCLQQSIEGLEDEYFCSECSQKIEEYDQFVQSTLQIETDLYERFQNKMLFNLKTESNIIEHEIFIHLDKKLENDDSKNHFSEFDGDSEKLSNKQKTSNIPNVQPKYRSTKESKKTKKKAKAFPKPHYTIEQVFCDICGRSYMSKGALSVHIVKHLKKCPHECNICKKTFTQRIGLKRHMAIHSGEKKHQCDVCGKQFIHSASFNMHKKIHINDRPKKCTICGAEFRSSSHITRHMRSHTGEKPYSCEICGQRFAQRYNMSTHYKTHQKEQKEPIKPHKCLICPETFIRREKLNDHLSQVHQAAFDSSFSSSPLTTGVIK